MSSVLRVLLGLVLVTAFSVPSGADPGPLCAVGEGPSAALQDDADSGGDAGDALSISLAVASDTSWSGALAIPGPSGPGDQADAYAADVGPAASNVMVRLDGYSGNPLYEELLVADVFAPDTNTPVLTFPMDGQTYTFGPEVGAWKLVVRFSMSDGDTACGNDLPLPAATPSEAATALKSYTLYIGCDPVCIDG